MSRLTSGAVGGAMSGTQAATAGKAFKELGKIKPKQWKGMKDTMKTMASQGLLSAITNFIMNLKVVQMIMKPINALFKVFINAVMKPLFPVLQPLIKALMRMMPIIEELGTLIGERLAVFMEALMPFIIELIDMLVDDIIPLVMEIIVEFDFLIPIFLELIPLLRFAIMGLRILISWIRILVGWIFGGSPGLIPGFEILAKIVEVVVKGIYDLVNLAFTFLITIITKANDAIQMIISAIQWLVNLIVGSLIGGINSITRALNAFAGVLREIRLLIQSITGGGGGRGGSGGGGGFNLGDYIPSFQGGGRTGNYEGLATVHKKETIIPDEELGQLGGTTVNINLTGAVIADEQSMNKLAMMLNEIMFVEFG